MTELPTKKIAELVKGDLVFVFTAGSIGYQIGKVREVTKMTLEVTWTHYLPYLTRGGKLIEYSKREKFRKKTGLPTTSKSHTQDRPRARLVEPTEQTLEKYAHQEPVQRLIQAHKHLEPVLRGLEDSGEYSDASFAFQDFGNGKKLHVVFCDLGLAMLYIGERCSSSVRGRVETWYRNADKFTYEGKWWISVEIPQDDSDE